MDAGQFSVLITVLMAGLLGVCVVIGYRVGSAWQ